MYIPNEYYKVLKYIYKHPSFSINNKKGIKFQKRHKYLPGRLQQILDELVDKGLIVITASHKDGRKRAIEDFHGPGPFETTADGAAYIEERFRNGKLFWIPYSITTFIALLSLLSNFL